MPALRSLDLFSGVGGITLALSGIAEPVAYCDSSLEARCMWYITVAPLGRTVHFADWRALSVARVWCCGVCGMRGRPRNG
jgi:hypothetical protein